MACTNTNRIDKQRTTLDDRAPASNRQILGRNSLLCILLLQCIVAFADPAPLVGSWQLDASASGDPAKELKGIRKSKRKKKPTNAGPDTKNGPLSDTQRRYWEHANDGKQWEHSKALAHAGPMQRLLESRNIEIVAADNGYLFIYADGYERSVIPNPGGRVFTASGDELVETDVGFTLAYWKEASLNLETRIADGGKLTERMAMSADGERLTYNIEIDRRDWKWIVKLERVFDRMRSHQIEANEK